MNCKTLYVSALLLGAVSCGRDEEKSSGMGNHPAKFGESGSTKIASVLGSTNTSKAKDMATTSLEGSPTSDSPAHHEARTIMAASEETVSIVHLARTNNLEQIAKLIRPAEESKVLRHAATKENVLKLLGNIEADKLKLGHIQFDATKSLVFVQIEEPVRLDLEYFFDPSSETQLRLQSIHP